MYINHLQGEEKCGEGGVLEPLDESHTLKKNHSHLLQTCHPKLNNRKEEIALTQWTVRRQRLAGKLLNFINPSENC